MRYLAEAVSETSGATVIVENKAGAAGNIAAEYTARADPDGYTVYVHAGSSTAMNYHLWNNPPIDPRTDLRGVAAINRQPFYILVRADSPIQTIQELNDFLIEQGENATYSTTATSGRVLGAAYTNALGVEPVEVQYSTGPDALVDLLSGAVDFGVADPVFAMVHAEEGSMRLLATGAGERMEIAPGHPDAGRKRGRRRADRLVGRLGAGRDAGRDRHEAERDVPRRARRAGHGRVPQLDGRRRLDRLARRGRYDDGRIGRRGGRARRDGRTAEELRTSHGTLWRGRAGPRRRSCLDGAHSGSSS